METKIIQKINLKELAGNVEEQNDESACYWNKYTGEYVWCKTAKFQPFSLNVYKAWNCPSVIPEHG